MERTEKLKQEYNKFWCKVLHTNEDLYSKMSLSDFVRLKKAISNINNIVTMKVTMKFVDFLVSECIITDSQANEIRKNVDSTSANTNGYDIEYTHVGNGDGSCCTETNERKIIAEVKCCIPVNDNSYGAAQEDSIIADIKGLLEGKNKSKIDKHDISDYLKFLVLLDDKEKNNVKTSAEKLVSKTNKKGYKVEIFESGNKLDHSKVYVKILNS